MSRRIDLNADPFIPQHYEVTRHHQQGTFAWSRKKIEFYLSEAQKENRVKGMQLQEEIYRYHVCNANLLDYWLANESIIPNECRRQQTFFWGTVYRQIGRELKYVRYLWLSENKWTWSFKCTAADFYPNNPALILNK